MAPPMAADVLKRERILLADIVREITWPDDTDIGFVETVGGVRAPLSHDADSVDLLKRLQVDEVLLVADAGLGTINAVQLCAAALAPVAPVCTILNRYDDADELHRRNRDWLAARAGQPVVTTIDELAANVTGSAAT